MRTSSVSLSHSTSRQDQWLTSLTMSFECDSKCLAISEAEWTSLRVYGFLRSPRVSEDGAASPTGQPVMMFISISDAVESLCVSQSCASVRSLHKVRLSRRNACHHIRSHAKWQHGFRARIHHIRMPYDQDDNGQAHFSKLMLHEYLKRIRLHESACAIS